MSALEVLSHARPCSPHCSSQNKKLHNYFSQYTARAGLRVPTWAPDELKHSTSEFCREHSLSKRKSTAQIFDAFIFDNELDMLEIRLLELNATVDFFILGELVLLLMVVRVPPHKHALKPWMWAFAICSTFLGCFSSQNSA